ncbi:MAG: hypothetical protein VW405_08090, partial [Rhodospirillaceae bacterium]
MKRTSSFQRHAVAREDGPDGTIYLRSAHTLGPVARRTGDWLHHWAEAAPDRTFLAQRHGKGWREIGFAETLERTRALGAALLGRGLTAAT